MRLSRIIGSCILAGGLILAPIKAKADNFVISGNVGYTTQERGGRDLEGRAGVDFNFLRGEISYRKYKEEGDEDFYEERRGIFGITREGESSREDLSVEEMAIRGSLRLKRRCSKAYPYIGGGYAWQNKEKSEISEEWGDRRSGRETIRENTKEEVPFFYGGFTAKIGKNGELYFEARFDESDDVSLRAGYGIIF